MPCSKSGFLSLSCTTFWINHFVVVFLVSSDLPLIQGPTLSIVLIYLKYIKMSNYYINFIPHSQFHLIEKSFLKPSNFPHSGCLAFSTLQYSYLRFFLTMILWFLLLYSSANSLALSFLMSPLFDRASPQVSFWEKVNGK